ncbi:response regulator [Belnapia sp. T6]|uniref:histidine kinase n=1 Tax=Belnapia mucosa TaxID=2804532 RepID=A0ABS1V4J3_9PROT|nr:hybrid sensor histidine kinase/response regulator [Belnapia mucosa]MBL6456596.1 response regulator [Belnapia mucosa]
MSGGQSAPSDLARLRGQVGTEQEMSFNRLVFALVFLLYFCTAGAPIAGEALPNLGWWTLISLGVFLHIRWRPGPNTPRRSFALLLDMGFLTWFLHIGGEIAAPFFAVYLWVVLGNGVRFGIPWLLAAMAVFFLGFGWVVLTTPFWRGNLHLSVGLLVAPGVLALYAMVLIRKLSQARRLAEQANEAKSQFLTSVSHELRTPLNAIIGMGGLLRDTRLDHEQQEMARTIDTAAKSLLSLINGILDFSRIEAGRATTRPESFALPALLQEVRALLLAQARQKGLRLALHVTARTPVRITSDRSHLRDILLNLAGNAVKFTERGAVTIAVDAEVVRPGCLRLRCEVSDTGIGISAEARARIFQRFTQADETIVNRFGGTGLGLAICKGLVELLDGEIGVESSPGEGSLFWFTAEMPVEPESEVAEALGGLGVLVVSRAGGAAGRLAGRLQAAGAQAAIHAVTEAGMAGLWDPADGVTAPPLHLLACIPARRLMALAASPPSAEALAELPLIALGDGMPDGLPGLGLRRQALMLLPADPPAPALIRALSYAGAQVQEAGEAMAQPAEAVTLRRILVADDNRVNRAVMQKILERAGHSVTLVEDGEAALDALETAKFDLVLMDVNMPGLDGIAATKLYRFTALGRPHVPIIGVTADAGPEAARNSREAGMDACLVKPIEPAQLLEAVAAYGKQSVPPPPAALPPPVSTTGPTEALDPKVVTALEALGGRDFATGLTRDFLEDAEREMERLRLAVQRGDVQQFRTAAHALRSSAANIGALGIFELSGTAEATSPGDLASGGPRQLALLAVELARVRRASERM